MAVLSGPEGLTDELLAAALREAHGGDVEVRGFRYERIGTGQMGDTFRVLLDRTGPCPPSIVAKFASRDESSRAIGLAVRAYEVEVRFYQELASRVASRSPHCYAADVDTATGAFTLLLEDAVDATPGDQLGGLDVGLVRDALGELAALHGSTMDQRFARDAAWLNRQTPDGEEFWRTFVRGLVPGFLARYEGALSATEAAVVAAVAGRSGTHGAPGAPRVAAHGDFRADNLLFPAGGGRPFVVDYQTMLWAHPALDVAYLVSGSLGVEVRREAEPELLSHYFDALESHLGRPFDREGFLDAYPHEARYGINLAVGASMVVERTERGDEMFLAHTRRHVAQLLDWGLEVTPDA
jgi:hypothetical protein